MSSVEGKGKPFVCRNDIEHIAENALGEVEYQPIISTASGGIYGYEALSRFFINGWNYTPDEVFGFCSDDMYLLNKLEYSLKEKQMSHHPSEDTLLFANISPKSIRTKICRDKWLDFLLESRTMTVELTESYCREDLESVHSFAVLLRDNNISFAVDDMLKQSASFSHLLLDLADVVRLDAENLVRMRTSKSFRKMIGGLVSFCKEEEKAIIAEGVENMVDFEIVSELGIEYCQGFHYRDKFISTRKEKQYGKQHDRRVKGTA